VTPQCGANTSTEAGRDYPSEELYLWRSVWVWGVCCLCNQWPIRLSIYELIPNCVSHFSALQWWTILWSTPLVSRSASCCLRPPATITPSTWRSSSGAPAPRRTPTLFHRPSMPALWAASVSSPTTPAAVRIMAEIGVFYQP